MLTSQQQATLKAYILSVPELAAEPMNSDGAYNVALALNQIASPSYWVWRTNVPIADLQDQITWANYTPADAPDSTVTWSNRSLACQGKQFNLQIILQGRSSFDASKAILRGGLNDATTALPSGAGGASRSGGWTAILAILKREARIIEKLFAIAGSGIGHSGGNQGDLTNPGVMTIEGTISPSDVEAARNS